MKTGALFVLLFHINSANYQRHFGFHNLLQCDVHNACHKLLVWAFLPLHTNKWLCPDGRTRITTTRSFPSLRTRLIFFNFNFFIF
ncbi:hypothetical protein CW304_25765 [Bacillus sp. UFRGS-B20]|nr:hypothetical protein CW304_25765 [Bacillus sp. UFRGS-B20]